MTDRTFIGAVMTGAFLFMTAAPRARAQPAARDGIPDLTVDQLSKKPQAYIGRVVRVKGLVSGVERRQYQIGGQAVPFYSFNLQAEDGEGRALPHSVWIQRRAAAFGKDVPAEGRELVVRGKLEWPWTMAHLDPPTEAPRLNATVADIREHPETYLFKNVRVTGLVHGLKPAKVASGKTTVEAYSFGLHEQDDSGRLVPHNLWVIRAVTAFEKPPVEGKPLTIDGIPQWGRAVARIEEY